MALHKYIQQTIWFLCGGDCSKMGSTGLHNLKRLNWDNSTIGVGNESSITKSINTNWVDSSASSSMGNLGSIDSWLINRDNSTISVGNKSMGISSSIRIGSIGISSITNGQNVMSKMSSSGKSNSRCVSRDNSSVGVCHQLGGGDGHTGSKNQKLHVECLGVFCARVQTKLRIHAANPFYIVQPVLTMKVDRTI